jgi:hypothetical protein
MSIQVAMSDEEIAACFPVMQQLRPHLKADEPPSGREAGCSRRLQPGHHYAIIP